MRISVITVCWNSAGTIGRAVDSFSRQTHSEKELVVVDGSSTDETLEVVASYGDECVRVISETDAGIYDAMNKGLLLFGGDAVGFLNSDDRFKDDRVLADIAAALDEHDIVHGNVDFVSGSRNGRVVRRWRGTPHVQGAFARGWMPPHPTVYARRRVIEAVGKFDLSYGIAADYDYMLRAFELHRFKKAFIDRVLVEMGLGGVSTGSMRGIFQSNLESLRSRRTWLNSGLVDRALIAKPLRKVRQFLPGHRGAHAP